MARTKDGKKPVKHWEPLKRATLNNAEADRGLKEAGGQCWINTKYQVVYQPLTAAGPAGPVHLSIKRRDRQPLLDWRDLQRIKNELVGDEREAVQLFPSESRMVDEANQFHLWVLPEGVQAPFGFTERRVGSPENAEEIGAVQREWDEPPADIDTADPLGTHMPLKMGWRGAIVEEQTS